MATDKPMPECLDPARETSGAFARETAAILLPPARFPEGDRGRYIFNRLDSPERHVGELSRGIDRLYRLQDALETVQTLTPGIDPVLRGALDVLVNAARQAEQQQLEALVAWTDCWKVVEAAEAAIDSQRTTPRG